MLDIWDGYGTVTNQEILVMVHLFDEKSDIVFNYAMRTLILRAKDYHQRIIKFVFIIVDLNESMLMYAVQIQTYK